jgi:signal transduction histidine kinase
LTIFSTSNAFFRQQRAGGIALLNDVATHGEVNIRILVPYDRRISEFISSLNANNNSFEKKSRTKKINVRYLEPVLNTKISILIVDRKSSLAVELKDDTKDNIQQAIGLSSYSNSKSTVLSYVSIFETLWKQTEMYQQLKVHDKMQKEFVDIAAHELRTPIQPILGLSEVVRSKLKVEDKELIQLLDVIKRNAQRLQRLTEDILDVSRIESQTLKMHKEKVNIGDRLLYVIGDTKKETPDPYKLKIFLTEPVGSYYVEADMGRLTQVVSNLLSNAVKFTDKGGEISVHVEKDDTNQQIIVSVKDNGQGIDPEIFPRLFSKFTSKSHVGTGLGLFISKKIIEAHGGRIWAQNNSGGKGSTFSFTLPMSQ